MILKFKNFYSHKFNLILQILQLFVILKMLFVLFYVTLKCYCSILHFCSIWSNYNINQGFSLWK